MGCCHQSEHHAVQARATTEECLQCEFDAFVRNHFFTGKMMGAPEFMAETHFHAEKMRHHNARLHGWGTVCGLKVKQHPSPECRRRYVVVEPGSALDCCGHEILVPHEEILDVGGQPHVQQLAQDGQLHTLQVCVRFRECPTEAVPVLYDECGCDDTQCAPNRILESYEFEVLVDPPLAAADLLGKPALGAFASTTLHGATGFARAANGKVAIVNPDDARRALILDPEHRSMLTVQLPAMARAIAVTPDGTAFVVVTDPVAGPECEVHVYKMDDGSAIAPGAGPRIVPGTTAASVILAAAPTVVSAGQRVFAVLDPGGGNLHLWDADAAHAITDAPAASIAVPAATSNLVVDGTHGFAIDAANLRSIDLAAATHASLAPPAGAQPVALALSDAAAKKWIAIARGADKRIDVVERAPGTATFSVALAHSPARLAAIGDWLYVLEEEAGHLWLQAIDLKSASAGVANAVTAPRAAGSATSAIVLLFADGQAGVIDAAQLADSDCADHLWKQLAGCPHCDLPNCVVLATLSQYRPGIEMLDPPPPGVAPAAGVSIIDNRSGRRMLASTATLQAWLECLQLKGGVPGPQGPVGPTGPAGANGTNGVDGKDGVGLNLDLPKIIDIAWIHGRQEYLDDLASTTLGIQDAADARQRLQTWDPAAPQGKPPLPLFTLYFNRKVTTNPAWWRQIFTLRVEAPLAMPLGRPPAVGSPRPYVSPGFYWPLDFKLYGDIVEVDPGAAPMRTPHTNENAACAVTFLLRREFFQLIVPATATQPESTTFGIGYLYLYLAGFAARAAGLDEPSINIRFNGAFVGVTNNAGRILQDGVLDGDNIGGRVGLNEVRGGPILGGKNPSGNMTQGGVFESWIRVLALRNWDRASMNAAALYMGSSPTLANIAAMPLPTSPNLASAERLSRIPEIDAELARRIVAERERALFRGPADLKRRLGLTTPQLEAIARDMLIA